MTLKSADIIRFPGEPLAEIEAAAAHWLAVMVSGQVSLSDLAEFELWRAASREHERVYRELEALWAGMVSTSEPQTRPAVAMPRSLHSAGLRWFGSRFAAIAAVVVFTLLVVEYLTTWSYEYHTAAGEIRRIALADGTIVHLKGNTALDADVGRHGPRRISLARGEAFFEVMHDPRRPFTVSVGNGVVEDIGTGFSVARYGSNTTVAVQHGEVAVNAVGLTDMLTAGQQVSFSAYAMDRKQQVDPGAISVWRRGLYVAERKALGQVLEELNEYYPGRILVTSRRLSARRVNAIVQLGHVDAWLDALNETPGVSVRRLGPLTVVSDNSE